MMTEAEWMEEEDDLAPMLELLRDMHLLTDRKWRLFGVACCERINHLLTDERSRRAVAVAERYADGKASAAELDEAFDASFDAGDALAREKERDPSGFIAAGRDPLRSAAWAANEVAHSDESADGLASEAADATESQAERSMQAVLLRDLFGNPFQPFAVEPSWLTSTVVALAEGIYQERAFDRMPILADALQDAGCDNDDILNHCRGPGEHVRGCWVLDLVLGKS